MTTKTTRSVNTEQFQQAAQLIEKQLSNVIVGQDALAGHGIEQGSNRQSPIDAVDKRWKRKLCTF